MQRYAGKKSGKQVIMRQKWMQVIPTKIYVIQEVANVSQ